MLKWHQGRMSDKKQSKWGFVPNPTYFAFLKIRNVFIQDPSVYGAAKKTRRSATFL